MSRGILKSGRKRQISCSKDAIEVFCRVRPINDNEETCAEILSETQIQLNAPKDSKSASKVEQVTCTFNKVFTEDVSQGQIYDQVGVPLVKDFLQGKNALCFMYGITGSGKTHTMNGHSEDGGVLPRCLDTVFNSINELQTPRCTFKPNGYNGFEIKDEEDALAEAEKKCQEMDTLMKNIDMCDMQRVPDCTKIAVEEDNNYAVFVSFVEIYNNSVFDLLEPEAFDTFKQLKPPVTKILREDPRRNMFVHDVNEIEVKDANEAYTLFLMGQNKRKTALTLMNAESSRSHCVFTIKLVQAPLNPRGDAVIKDPTMVCISQLSLCDLAGSERISRTKTEGERIRQAGHINNSLMTLRSCLECLRENQKEGGSSKVVPYRDAKLTHLFKNYFDGDGKVNMIVCLNPRTEDFDESLHVMRFAEMTQEVKVARSEVHKFDTGLTAGRGKASKLFKLMSQSEDSGSDTGSECMAPPAMQMFQPWPPHQLAGCNDSETLVNFMKYLEDRWKLRTTLINDWKEKAAEVRRLIVQLEEDNVDLTKALEEQRGLLSEKEKEARTYEKRIRSLNERYDNLQRSSQSFESQKRQLTADLEKQKELTAKEKQEKLKLKQTLKDLTSTERLRWEKVCDRKVQDKQKEMEEQVLRRNEKLNQLRSVLDNLQIPAENQRRLTQIINDEKMPVCNNQVNKENKCCCSVGKESSQLEKVCSCTEPTVKTVVSKIKKTPRAPHSTRNIKGESLSTPRKPKVRSRSPPPTSTVRKNDVAPVRGKHRRSRSTDFYLNHKPADTLHTDTMMKPVLKNKKTVATPSAKDLKVVPGYVLTHQEEDSSGEICTKLIKGDVLPTRSGGAAVQFTDVEILTNLHKPAGAPVKSVASKAAKYEKKVLKQNRDNNKRHAEDDSVDSQDSWTDVETRCAIGIEGKPGAEPGIMHHSKKVKH